MQWRWPELCLSSLSEAVEENQSCWWCFFSVCVCDNFTLHFYSLVLICPLVMYWVSLCSQRCLSFSSTFLNCYTLVMPALWLRSQMYSTSVEQMGWEQVVLLYCTVLCCYALRMSYSFFLSFLLKVPKQSLNYCDESGKELGTFSYKKYLNLLMCFLYFLWQNFKSLFGFVQCIEQAMSAIKTNGYVGNGYRHSSLFSHSLSSL